MSPLTRGVLSDLGGLLAVPGGVALTALVVSAVAGESDGAAGLAVTAAASLVLGLGLRQLCWDADADDLPAPLGTVTVALGWLGCAAFAALPFLLWPVFGGDSPTALALAEPANAYFEGMSALTSTGLSVAPDVTALPHALQWWRSALEWVGGMGVVLLALTLFDSRAKRTSLVTAEINVEEMAEDDDHAVSHLWVVYGGLTLASVLAFWALGMPLWQALNHGMTGVATGGMTVNEGGFSAYGPAIRVAGTVVMIAGGLDFAVHAKVFVQRDWRTLGRDAQTLAYATALVVGGLLLLGTTALGSGASAVDAAFMWASALATCGFSSVDLPSWSPAALVLLIAAMFVGAAAGSTGGGLKIRRVWLLATNVLWQVRGADDQRERQYLSAGSALEPDEAFELLRRASALAFAFTASLLAGTFALLLLLPDAAPLDVLFEAASALGAVGLSSGVTSPDLGAAAKAVLVALMWLGRLEVMAALMIGAAALDRFRPGSDGA